MTEHWRPVIGFDGYEVSDLARIRSFRRTNTKILTPFPRRCRGRAGFTVTLRKDNKNVTLNLHRLVAQAFIPNPLNLPEVNHKNGRSNAASNLEWRSHAGNELHAVQNNLKSGDGITFDPSQKKWRVIAPIRKTLNYRGRRELYIGKYSTYEEAKAARLAAILTLGEVL